MIRLIKNKIRIYKSTKKFIKVFENTFRTNTNSKEDYITLRNLFVTTKGKLNDDLSKIINKKRGKYVKIENNGIIKPKNNKELLHQVELMRKDGFYIFDAVLPQNISDSIFEYAKKTPVSYLEVATEKQDISQTKVLFDESNIISPRYQFSGNEIFGCQDLQQLIFDQSLLAFAQEYLGCKPILDLVAFWWSAPFHGKGKSAAAQMFHFDLDRIKFMKFFFYITDVDSETGPHCFVKGSHGKLPKAINRDGRFEDDEIEKIYGKDNLLELCGKRGSIMAVDTRGFHKGKDLTKGKRLLFQIQFTNSLFGQSYDKIDYNLIEAKHKKLVNQYPESYSNIS